MKKYATIKAKQQFGTIVSFKKSNIYGTVDAPETGDVTVDLNDAKLGVVSQMIHNDSTAPSYPANFELRGGGAYVTGQNNYISFEYFSPTKIIYTIL